MVVKSRFLRRSSGVGTCFYTGIIVTLSENQQRQADAIASLLTQPDRGAIIQGVELATALGDQAIIAWLLGGVEPNQPVPRKRAQHRRFNSVQRGPVFDGDGNTSVQPWRDLAMVHLIAASDLPLRHKVTSIALGAPSARGAKKTLEVWLDGLDRLPALTHLDLFLAAREVTVDLSLLTAFPKLTHLRVRGASALAPLPSLESVRELDVLDIEFVDGATFPALRRFRGRVPVDTVVTPDLFPDMVDIEARGDLRLEGFESLGKLWCFQGIVDAPGLHRVENVRVNGKSFHAPDLRHIGHLARIVHGMNVSQLETLESVKMNRSSRFSGGAFPEGTTLGDPKVVLWGPDVVDLGNLGELAGLEVLNMTRVKNPVALDTLAHATDLRVLDIRNSPGIRDLSPLVGLPNLETVLLHEKDDPYIPAELESRIELRGPKARRRRHELQKAERLKRAKKAKQTVNRRKRTRLRGIAKPKA